ncbi:MAG TPA: hypothetical protein P5108_02825 [Marmoricola sp.]|jgi:hypothetical protein|nr:hypothetical protein [Nocardioidaceae bacterium]HMU36114.1 hypothetical protein [Marmoricola sp.]MCB8992579.1 hypothetical protein [Nocardioidaceae bacterium]MCO5323670.1 hypothetical protein [Nocardioidaceae bacterium]HMY09330.1 hypothetical protein [Marmoricola sp.]
MGEEAIDELNEVIDNISKLDAQALDQHLPAFEQAHRVLSNALRQESQMVSSSDQDPQG